MIFLSVQIEIYFRRGQGIAFQVLVELLERETVPLTSSV